MHRSGLGSAAASRQSSMARASSRFEPSSTPRAGGLMSQCATPTGGAIPEDASSIYQDIDIPAPDSSLESDQQQVGHAATVMCFLSSLLFLCYASAVRNSAKKNNPPQSKSVVCGILPELGIKHRSYILLCGTGKEEGPHVALCCCTVLHASRSHLKAV